MNSAKSLYTAGGAVPVDSVFYVQRETDRVLYDALQNDECCYLLTPRQMGKSSLIAQVSQRLHNDSVHVVRLDLQDIGSNLTVEQWYFGLMDSVCESLDLQEELENWIEKRKDSSPLQMWQQALREVVLTSVSGKIVIFVDEIDYVRGMAFSTDEFFAAIRSCLNARATQPEYRRLTFCLVGSALPTDLIMNPQVTPFNIGRRLDLYDFTLEEVRILQNGLGHDETTNRLLMERIYHWTNGHPYLTHRLCKTVAEDDAALTPKQVDDHCHRIFLQFGNSSERDSNLLYVQQRLLLPPEKNATQEQADERRAALLTLYRNVWTGRRVRDDAANPLVGPVKLSGAVRSENGLLQVRNRIYRQIFDKSWIMDNLTNEEVRRQKSAYRKGVLRTALLSAGILTPTCLFALIAVWQGREARLARDQTKQGFQQTRRLLYTVDMFQSFAEWKEGLVSGVVGKLEEHTPDKDSKDLRGWEYRYLWGLTHWEQQSLRGHTREVYVSAFAPNGKWFATGSFDRTVRLWNAATFHTVWTSEKYPDTITSVLFSPNSHVLAIGCKDRTLRLIDTMTLREFHPPISGFKSWVRSLAFLSPTMLLAGSADEVLTINITTGQTQRVLSDTCLSETGFALSPDGKTLAKVVSDSQVHFSIAFWDVTTWQKRSQRQLPLSSSAESLCFSPSGKYLAVGGAQGDVTLYSPSTGKHRVYSVGKNSIHGIGFSPDESLCVLASWDNRVIVMETRTGTPRKKITNHLDRVNTVTFAPNSQWFLTTSNDMTTRTWDLPRLLAKEEKYSFKLKSELNSPRFYAAAGNRCYSLKNGALQCYDIALQREVSLGLHFEQGTVLRAVSADGKRIATSKGVLISLWDTVTQHKFQTMECSHKISKLHLDTKGHLMAAVMFTSAPDKPNKVIVWNVETKEKLLTAMQPQGMYFPIGVIFSFDSRFLTLAWEDSVRRKNGVTLWEIATQREVFQDGQVRNNILGMAFSPDSTLLAVVDWSREIALMEVATGKRLTTFQGHREAVSSVAFSIDSKTMATAGQEGVVKLWNTRTYRAVGQFEADVRDLQFSADGRFLGAMSAMSKNPTFSWWEAPKTLTSSP